MTSSSLYLSIISLGLYGGILHAQGDSVADFRSRAISEWEALSEKITSMRGEVTREDYYSQSHQPLWLRTRNHCKYGFRRDAGLLIDNEMEDFDEKGVSTAKFRVLNIANVDYTADLNWKKEAKGWSLTDLKMRSDRDELKKFCDVTAIPWLMICDNVSVLDLIREPSFVISRIEQLAGSPGLKPLRVQFRNDGSRQRSTNATQYVQTGFIDMDAGKSYRIMGYEVHWKDKISEGDRKGVMEYEEGEGIPIQRTMVQEWPEHHNKKRGLLSSKSIISLKFTYNSGPSDEEFRLSHYGLPEPMGVKPLPSSRNWLWLLAAAVTAAALAILFAWLKRRRSMASQARTQAATRSR